MNNVRQTASSLKLHLSPILELDGRAGSWPPHQGPRWQDTLSFGAAFTLHWFPLLSLAHLLCTCAMQAWLSLPAQKSQAQPTGSIPMAELQPKRVCSCPKHTLCAEGFVTAGAPLGPHGTVYVAGRVNSFPSSLFLTQQQQNATCPVHGKWLEQQCQRYLGHLNLVKKGSTLQSPNTHESLSYSPWKLMTSSPRTQGKE